MEKANNALHQLGSAAHAAKRAADIVFVLQNKEHLNYAALVDRLNQVLLAYGEHDSEISGSDLDELKAVSRKLYAVFAANSTDEAAEAINTVLSDYASPPRLSAHGQSPWHIHVDSDDHAPWAEWFAASSALALAVLLAEKRHNPSGLCASPSCRRPFIDLGKGGGRSYCSPRCATRERVAAYRKTRKTATLPNSN
jgi:predicted RNA-binding Zn ribbon-like protein